jgi:hypothetical protein
MQRVNKNQAGWSVVALLCVCGAAQGQAYSTDFEPPTYTGSAAGTLLTNGFGGPAGQDGWYNPVAASIDFNVHTYTGNTLAFPANPTGGTQFVGVTGQVAPSNIGRAQHAVNFSAGGTWTVEWDVIGGIRGATTAVDNLGSFSLQPSATANYFQQIMQWGTNTTAPTQYNINYGVFPAAGGAAPAFVSPGAAWTNIPVDHWIRQSTTWSFTSSRILSVSIRDITAGGPTTTVDVSGLDWFLAGGLNNVLAKPLPTDIRLFTGNVNNVTGWDNVSVGPAAVGCYPNCDNSTTAPILNVQDFTCFLQRYAAGDSYANCDNSTTAPVLNVQDFTCFLQSYAAGCP